MDINFSHLTLNELIDLRFTVDQAITKRKQELMDERFSAMIKAIEDFRDVCPYAEVRDDEYSFSVMYLVDPENWWMGK